MLDEKTESRILDFIESAREPIHCTEIAKALGINRVTTTKYLSVLHSKGLVSYKSVGMAKIWAPVESPILQAFGANDTKSHAVQALNAIADGVCVIDRGFNIVWANREMEKRHGSLREIKGKKCFEVFRDDESVCKNCAAKKAFETGKQHVAEAKAKGGKIEISASPLKDRKGRVIAVIEIVQREA